MFKAIREKQCDKFIKVFKIDNGGEYMSNGCDSFCKQHG